MLYPVRLLACFIAFACSALVLAQVGPNTVAADHHNLRTLSGNGTWFIVAIDEAKVAKAVGKYPLGPVPRNDKRLFPKGFPKRKHPVLVASVMTHDIRRGNLEIDYLYSGAVIVPFVDGLGDGTPLQYAVTQYIGGAFGNDLMGVVPALVGSINSGTIFLGHFFPNDTAYQTLASNQFSSQIKKVVVPNPVTGPGVVPSAVDLLFSSTSRPKYTARAFHSLLNQPSILQNRGTGSCQRNIYLFNETFSKPIMRKGSVTLYAGTLPAGLEGTYDNQYGYSANGELISFDPQKCSTLKRSPMAH